MHKNVNNWFQDFLKLLIKYRVRGQLIRSSSSPGANYIEAIRASSRKDFTHRLKICRKEAKESTHWLRLIESTNNQTLEIKEESEKLIKEAP